MIFAAAGAAETAALPVSSLPERGHLARMREKASP